MVGGPTQPGGKTVFCIEVDDKTLEDFNPYAADGFCGQNYANTAYPEMTMRVVPPVQSGMQVRSGKRASYRYRYERTNVPIVGGRYIMEVTNDWENTKDHCTGVTGPSNIDGTNGAHAVPEGVQYTGVFRTGDRARLIRDVAAEYRPAAGTYSADCNNAPNNTFRTGEVIVISGVSKYARTWGVGKESQDAHNPACNYSGIPDSALQLVRHGDYAAPSTASLQSVGGLADTLAGLRSALGSLSTLLTQ